MEEHVNPLYSVDSLQASCGYTDMTVMGFCCVVVVINIHISGYSHPQLYKHVVQIVEKFVKKVSAHP